VDIEQLIEEIRGYRQQLNVEREGEHLYSNYQEVMAVMWRVSEIREEISYLELLGTATPQQRKFRTAILDPFIDRLHDMATFESRKITAKGIEAKVDR
jgi:hypothetical protein